jgi:hypothetical protein
MIIIFLNASKSGRAVCLSGPNSRLRLSWEAEVPHAPGSPANWIASSYCLILDSDSYSQFPAPLTSWQVRVGTHLVSMLSLLSGTQLVRWWWRFKGVLSALIRKCLRHTSVQSTEKEVGQIGCGRDLSSLQRDYSTLLSVSASLSQEMSPAQPG